MSEDVDGFSFRAFEGESLLSRDRCRFVAGFLARPPPLTAMVVNTSLFDIESSTAAVAAAEVSVVDVAAVCKGRLSITQTLTTSSYFGNCPESSSNASAVCDKVTVAPSSIDAVCRVDLSASGGDGDKLDSSAVSTVVAAVLALMSMVVVGEEPSNRDDG